MRSLSLILLGVFVLVGCRTPQPSETNSSTSYETYTIDNNGFSHENYIIGTIKPATEITIGTEAGGKIMSITSDIGDTVTQGQQIMKIDSDESASQANAASSMASALTAVKANTELMFDEQIKAMERQLQQAKQRINMANIGATGQENNQDDSLTTINQHITTAQKQYDNTKQLYDTKATILVTNSKNALNQGYILSEEILEYTDKILGISNINKNINDDYEAGIGVRDITLVNTTKEQRRTLQQQKESLSDTFATTNFSAIELTNSDQKEELTTFLNQAIIYMESLESFLKNMQTIIENTLETKGLTTTMIQERNQTITTYQQQIEGTLISVEGDNLLGIKGSKQSIDTFLSQRDTDLTNLEEQLHTLEKQKTAIQNGTDTSTAIANEEVTLAEQSYESLKNQLAALREQKNVQLASIQSQIAQSKGQANQAWVMVNNASITAPFDGVIMEKYVDQGAIVGPGVPLVKFGTTHEPIIELHVPEIYRNDLHLKQIIDISVNDIAYKATITHKAPATDNITKTLLIKATIDNENIPLGAIAYAYLPNETTQEHTTTITIPRDFIRYEYGTAYVRQWDETTQSTQRVTITQETCQDNHCLITEGLQVGDTIIRM